MADLFDNKPVDPTPQPVDLPQESYLDALVGEGKKFSSQEGLARGKYESDLYVTQLQSENAAMRAALTEQESVSELLDKAFEKQAVAPQEPAEPVVTEAPAPQVSQEHLQQLVEAQVNSRLNADQKQANIDHVHQKAQEAYGDNYAVELTNRASTLGIGKDFLESIAGDQPAAFLELMVPTGQTTPAPAPTLPVGSLTSDVPQIGKPKSMGDYLKQQKEARANMKQSDFFSPAVQNEIFAAAKAQGPDFFE